MGRRGVVVERGLGFQREVGSVRQGEEGHIWASWKGSKRLSCPQDLRGFYLGVSEKPGQRSQRELATHPPEWLK